MSIILCEPQCAGFEHAAFNAALLCTVGAAFPDDEIVFFAETTHRREIEKVLISTQAPPLQIDWRAAQLPTSRGLRRLPAERALVQSVLAVCGSTAARSSTPARGVLFCSATEITILALKQLLRSVSAPPGIHIVLHGVLRSLEEPRWRKPWRWGFSLRQALRMKHPPNLKYIALSQSICDYAARAEPSLKDNLRAIDMPRLWNSEVSTKRDSARARFGFFGSTAKGFAPFYEIARAVKSQNLAADFSLVGFLNGRDLQCDYNENIVAGLSRSPIDAEEYARRAAAIDYAVWPANAAHYRLTASASFLDALDYLKPVIYLANPYIDAYAQQLGDIGYRCETLAQMQNVIETLAREFPAERYEQQRAALLRGREIFEPTKIAPTLKAIIEEHS